MELEGAKRCFQNLKKDGIRIDTFISDRHRAITKWIRNDQKSTKHFFDIWHVARNITKKMMQAAKEKGFEVIGKWVRAVRNHIYWAATSTTCGFGKLIVAKWSSFIRHVADKHENHPDNLFPNCIHGTLCEKRDWIHIGNSIKFCTNLFEICCVIPTTFQILLDEVARKFKVLPISA